MGLPLLYRKYKKVILFSYLVIFFAFEKWPCLFVSHSFSILLMMLIHFLFLFYNAISFIPAQFSFNFVFLLLSPPFSFSSLLNVKHYLFEVLEKTCL